jgi:hypothetical protein
VNLIFPHNFFFVRLSLNSLEQLGPRLTLRLHPVLELQHLFF